MKNVKNDSLKTKPDPKLHIRKTVAGGATGLMLGAAVAGPIGAVLGGALGTYIGKSAEKGRAPKLPKPIAKRSGITKPNTPSGATKMLKRSVRPKTSSGSGCKATATSRKTSSRKK